MHDQTQDGAADARRLKKRELDRKAQRLARERTKSRIAQLETMVENLRQTDSNSQISSLMDQLGQVTKERDNLLQVLNSLGTTIRRHLDDASPAEQSRNAQLEASSQIPSGVSLVPTGVERVRQASRTSSEASGPTGMELQPMESQLVTFGNDAWDCSITCDDSLPPAMAFDNSMITHGGGELIPLPGLLPDVPQTTSEDVIIPTPPMICHCTSPSSCASNYHAIPSGNTWRAANEALGKSTKLSPEEATVEDYTAEDTPVRAVLEGWDSVERAGKMTASWRKLRKIDEVCFHQCPNTERLAILRMMHLLMTYHGEPTLTRRASLPRWFLMRPSQALAHSYAIDYFVWPGVRERFVFSQHQYCTNTFWDLFQSNLKVLWPYDFRDTYLQNSHTGKFQLSPMFEERIRDINAWTMSSDFFTHFPELYEDIPPYLGIPASLGGMPAIQAAQYQRQDENANEVVAR
ncbi:hypothetical protein FDECE_12708 [Fusarium decemcellulare]|nr:hypothetical protein FDECE_12708 [Fusarium decemcellulare]